MNNSDLKENISAMVAKEIREMGMNDVLDEDTIEKIKEKTKKRAQQERDKEEKEDQNQEEILENEEEDEDREENSEEKLEGGLADNKDDDEFDYKKLMKGIEIEMKHHTNDFQTAKEIVKDNLIEDPNYYDEEGGNEESEGEGESEKENYPELPSFIHKIEPAEILIFDKNELSHGGENLANVPFRTVEDPDCKKSIHNFWVEEGKQKANVYLAKFEKVGQIEFDYRNGTAQYVDNRVEDVSTSKSGEHYQENPYSEEPKPEIEQSKENSEERGFESYIKSSVDLETKVQQYIEDILKDYVLKKETPSDNAEYYNDDDSYLEESESNKKEESNKKSIQENNIQMKDIVKDERNYVKIDTPEDLKESLQGNGDGNAKLISEGESVEEWELEGKKYYLPKGRISDKKCYTKKNNL